MSLGISDDHVELAATLRSWAESLDGPAAARASADDPTAGFDAAWASVREMGLPAIAVPEAADGGGGGDVLDLAVALEAAAYGLVPGRLLGTAVAALAATASADPGALGSHPVLTAIGAGRSVALGITADLQVADTLTGTVPVVLDAPGAELLLLGGTDADGSEHWFLLEPEAVVTTPCRVLDLTRRAGAVEVRGVPVAGLQPVPGLDSATLRRAALTAAAAEAAGVARRCLALAVEHAGVREQFGRPIGSFQAVKHLCAGMLETAEAITAVAWDAARAVDAVVTGHDTDAEAQWELATRIAGEVALDGAVRAAQDCIQVLGGIGFTFEHEAHLHLRRAGTLRSLLGSGDAHAVALAGLAAAGGRRRMAVDLAGRDEAVRPGVRDAVRRVAALPADQQRAGLVDEGLLAPHWPAPYGRGADPMEQLVIDEELAGAGVARPDLQIGAWAVPTILEHGTDAQRERFVRPTLLGDLVWCQLFSEPGAGSDLASLRTRAERVEGGWRLTGQKVWTSLAHEADFAICLARTDPDAPQHRGISYFVVEMSQPGLDVRPLREMTGEAMFNEVFLDEVFVPDDQLVGAVDNGWRLARTTLANERVAMAGSQLGASTEQAVALVGPDTPERDLVRIGHQVALATVAGLLGLRTTLRSLAGQGPGAESSVAKLAGVRNRQDASELVVDLLGHRVFLGEGEVAGVSVEGAVHEMLLTRCLSIAGGTTQVLRNVIGERILGLPR